VRVLLANVIGDEGVKRMDEALNRHTSLKSFYIDSKKTIHNFGADTCQQHHHHHQRQRNRTNGIRKLREDAQQAPSPGGFEYFR